MNLNSYTTMIFAKWIRYNNLTKRFGLARDVNEFKRLVSQRLFGNSKPSESFIKGARMAD